MKNRTARLLKGSAVGLWALGAVAALWLWFRWKPAIEDAGNWTAAAVALGVFLTGLLPWALGEIVAILHDIRANGPAPRPAPESEAAKPGLYVEDMVSFQPAEPEPDPALEQVESFIWVCGACGEIHLSGSGHCRICKAERTDGEGGAEPPKA